MDIDADPEAVCEVIRDWPAWPETFPSTIAAVTLLASTESSLTLQVQHKTEGSVINILEPDQGGAIRLKEFKRSYDAQFSFFSMPACSGSVLHVHGCIWLKGWLAWLSCATTPLARSRMRKYLLEPVRLRAEQLGSASPILKQAP